MTSYEAHLFEQSQTARIFTWAVGPIDVLLQLHVQIVNNQPDLNLIVSYGMKLYKIYENFLEL